jgi:glycine cleavage system H protein
VDHEDPGAGGERREKDETPMTESYPAELSYHREHGWARVDGQMATLGITWYAQDNLQEILYVDPPQVGDHVTKDHPYAEVESVKTVSEVYAPLSGEVVEVNAEITDGAGTVNEDPYGRGWLVKVRLSDPSEIDALLSAEEYRATLTA